MIGGIKHGAGRTGKGEIDKAQPEFDLLVNGYIRVMFQVLLEQFFCFGIGQVLLVREGGGHTSGNIAKDFLFMGNSFPWTVWTMYRNKI